MFFRAENKSAISQTANINNGLLPVFSGAVTPQPKKSLLPACSRRLEWSLSSQQRPRGLHSSINNDTSLIAGTQLPTHSAPNPQANNNSQSLERISEMEEAIATSLSFSDKSFGK